MSWLERALGHLTALSFTTKISLRNIFRNRRRTIYTAGGITFALILVLVMLGLPDSMKYMVERQSTSIELFDVEASLSAPQKDSLITEIANWEGVKEIEPAVNGFGRMSYDGEEKKKCLILGLQPQSKMYHPNLPEKAEPPFRKGEIILTSDLEDTLGVEVGDEVKSGSAVKEFRIAGFSEEVLGGTAYIALADAQQMAGLGDAFNAIWLKVDPAMTQAIRQKLYQLSMIESVQLKDEIVDDWNEMLSLFYRIMLVSLIFAAVMAFAVVFNTITVNAAEREREIATMRTIGESRGNITKMVTLENTITRLMGVIPGLVLGAAVAYYIIQSYSSELWQMAFHIYPSTYLWATLGIIAVAFVSQIIPIRRLNRLNLAKATKVLD